MMKTFLCFFCLLFCFSPLIYGQVPEETLGEIVKAEDERRLDNTLDVFLKSTSQSVRQRAILAMGRIGDERGLLTLIIALNGRNEEIKEMAAFAIGEIESVKGANALLSVLANPQTSPKVRAKVIEAAGKIAQVVATTEKAKFEELGRGILEALKTENQKKEQASKAVIIQGLTAVLRSRPANAETVLSELLNNNDAQIRAGAGNVIARLRLKNPEINTKLREILTTDTDAIAIANAARALGSAEDKEAVSLLLKLALNHSDSRVRVSAIRTLGNFKDAQETKEFKVIDSLLQRTEKLLADSKKSKFRNFSEKSEVLEIATTLGRLSKLSEDEKIFQTLLNFAEIDGFISPEISIALAGISPEKFIASSYNSQKEKSWQIWSALIQGYGEIIRLPQSEKTKNARSQVEMSLKSALDKMRQNGKIVPPNDKGFSDFLTAYALLKTDDLGKTLIETLKIPDATVRATVAELIGEQQPNNEFEKALDEAFLYSNQNDTKTNDATLAILSALGRQPKAKTNKSLEMALNSADILVRRRAVETLKTQGIDVSSKLGTVKNSVFKTADYLRAVSRKNGQFKAVVKTEKGTFTIDLLPEDAPLTVDNFIKLAQAKYFNGLSVHRVVPNFVMQDGDPQGDGNGGPGWQIRCEINTLEYQRGMVGMALSGKDTGGSQWFITHSWHPHLDGGYTIFGKVAETDMKIVDAIVRGDKIISIKIKKSK